MEYLKLFVGCTGYFLFMLVQFSVVVLVMAVGITLYALNVTMSALNGG